MEKLPLFMIVKAILNGISTITMMPHEIHALSNHRRLDYWSSSLFRLTAKKTSKHHIAVFGWEPKVDYLLKGPEMKCRNRLRKKKKKIPWHDIIVIFSLLLRQEYMHICVLKVKSITSFVFNALAFISVCRFVAFAWKFLFILDVDSQCCHISVTDPVAHINLAVLS